MGTRTLLSKRRSAAISSSQGIFVVANTETDSGIRLISSIYLKNSVLILLSVSDSLPVRLRPKLSISSIRIIEGACSLASSNSKINFYSLSPIYFEVMSVTDTQKQVAFE